MICESKLLGDIRQEWGSVMKADIKHAIYKSPKGDYYVLKVEFKKSFYSMWDRNPEFIYANAKYVGNKISDETNMTIFMVKPDNSIAITDIPDTEGLQIFEGNPAFPTKFAYLIPSENSEISIVVRYLLEILNGMKIDEYAMGHQSEVLIEK